MKDKVHLDTRDKVEQLLNSSKSIDLIAKEIGLPLGSRFVKGSAKWYKFCVIAKRNQRIAITKHPDLYSIAGRIAQQKHPELGHRLGKKYGPIQGKLNAQRLKGNKQHFSQMAKRLQEINPLHSKYNMEKAHETMKAKGNFNEHQREAALKCIEKHPNQLFEMSKKAHSLYPLALLALESRRKNWPYEFMDCFFDSASEKKLCELLVQHKLIDIPVEGKNVHFRIKRYHVDFFIGGKIFLEFHPPLKFGKNKGESVKSYYAKKREILDVNGYAACPLVVIDRLNGAETKINKIKELVALKLNE